MMLYNWTWRGWVGRGDERLVTAKLRLSAGMLSALFGLLESCLKGCTKLWREERTADPFCDLTLT